MPLRYWTHTERVVLFVVKFVFYWYVHAWHAFFIHFCRVRISRCTSHVSRTACSRTTLKTASTVNCAIHHSTLQSKASSHRARAIVAAERISMLLWTENKTIMNSKTTLGHALTWTIWTRASKRRSRFVKHPLYLLWRCTFDAVELFSLLYSMNIGMTLTVLLPACVRVYGCGGWGEEEVCCASVIQWCFGTETRNVLIPPQRQTFESSYGAFC